VANRAARTFAAHVGHVARGQQNDVRLPESGVHRRVAAVLAFLQSSSA